MICHLPDLTGVRRLSMTSLRLQQPESVKRKTVIAFFPDRESPLFKKLYGIINVSSEIIYKSSLMMPIRSFSDVLT